MFQTQKFVIICWHFSNKQASLHFMDTQKFIYILLQRAFATSSSKAITFLKPKKTTHEHHKLIQKTFRLSSLNNFTSDPVPISQPTSGIKPVYFVLFLFLVVLINIGALYFIFRVFSKKYVYYSDDNTFQMSLLSNQY